MIGAGEIEPETRKIYISLGKKLFRIESKQTSGIAVSSWNATSPPNMTMLHGIVADMERRDELGEIKRNGMNSVVDSVRIEKKVRPKE